MHKIVAIIANSSKHKAVATINRLIWPNWDLNSTLSANSTEGIVLTTH